MGLLAQLGLGLALSSAIGALAYWRGSLNRSGVLGAIITGTAIFGFGGLTWGLLLVLFFVSSSLLSRYRESDKESLSEKFDKGSQRDIGQALANAGLGSLLAVGLWIIDAPLLLLAAFAGAMATVNADTWATELGVLHRSPPRLITTWQVVEPGTSGGVTLTGLFAKIGGAGVIGVGAWLLTLLLGAENQPALILAALLGGLAGSYFDSLLGATVQAIYWCPADSKETERHPLHSCGTPTEYRRGWRWLSNDMVNFVSSVLGAAVALGVGLLFV